MSAPDSPDPSPSRLPPELAFLTQLPDFKSMEDDEMLVFMQGYLARLREHRELLRQHGRDPERMIARVEHDVRKLEQACQAVEQAEDQLLQATADLADTERELCRMIWQQLKLAREHNPFDPRIEEWEEHIEAIREHLPPDTFD